MSIVGDAAAAGVTVDTKANILALTPSDGAIGFSTDTLEVFFYSSSVWYMIPFATLAEAAAPDMGYIQDSSRIGYHPDYITDKQLSNIYLGGSALTDNGGLRVDVDNTPDTFEVYLRAAWQTIIYDLTTDDGDFRHAPVSESIYVWRGQSVNNGLNGRPMVNEYKVSMGAHPPPRVVSGGTF